ncbi:radical SAM family heme chaperone HemW [Candidatus Sororendozoicomonas aggregata]|uniref:radical SAM family heme chaperone HemW n=1 Tax=Candidatus Sororendozoicomonas aggregata TaxID=3073239 RepID=UPI002ED0EC16
MLRLPPLSLYIHVPWCVKKCPYCDFNSHVANQEGIPETQYLAALIADLHQEISKVQGRPLASIFIGGGTPSLLSPRAYKQLLSTLQQEMAFAEDIEITLEANPGTYEHGRFQGYLEAGINRLSLGVQSFQDEKLKGLGRIHSADEAICAITSLAESGFANINIDLMHGLPGQSPEDALYDLQTAIDFQPTHISWYQLTIEPNTVFYSKTPLLPPDDTLWSIQEAGQSRLAMHGYTQYEISAYSRPGRQARHNVNYWQFGDYLGIGAGAHGKWTCKETGKVYRNWKTRIPSDYLSPDKPFRAGQRTLAEDELPLEFMMNALRLHEGVPAGFYSDYTGLSLRSVSSAWETAIAKGLMVDSPNRLAPTPRGRLFLNDLLAIFT